MKNLHFEDDKDDEQPSLPDPVYVPSDDREDRTETIIPDRIATEKPEQTKEE